MTPESVATRPTLADLSAGVSNAFVYLPQGIGYAILCGVHPIYGLYTGFLPPIIAAFTTGSVFMQVIATNELSIPIGRIAASVEGGFTAEKLFALTLLVGVFALIAGLLRLGRAMRYVANGVMTGIRPGPDAAPGREPGDEPHRLPPPARGRDLPRLGAILPRPEHIDPAALVVGLASIAATARCWRRRCARFAYLITLSVATVGAARFSPHAHSGRCRRPHRRRLPVAVLPDLDAIPSLVLPALTLTIVGLSFGAGVAQQFPVARRTRRRSFARLSRPGSRERRLGLFPVHALRRIDVADGLSRRGRRADALGERLHRG